jgi:hypothetical protein
LSGKSNQKKIADREFVEIINVVGKVERNFLPEPN